MCILHLGKCYVHENYIVHKSDLHMHALKAVFIHAREGARDKNDAIAVDCISPGGVLGTFYNIARGATFKDEIHLAELVRLYLHDYDPSIHRDICIDGRP